MDFVEIIKALRALQSLGVSLPNPDRAKEKELTGATVQPAIQPINETTIGIQNPNTVSLSQKVDKEVARIDAIGNNSVGVNSVSNTKVNVASHTTHATIQSLARLMALKRLAFYQRM